MLIVNRHYLWMALIILLQVLGEMDGDVDSAIEYMIAERHAAAYDDTSVKLVMAGTGCSSVAAVEHV